MGVITLAATNRPEILDPALLRPGRFDRQVVLDRPDLKGRGKILRVHVRDVKLAPGLDLSRVAARTPGLCGRNSFPAWADERGWARQSGDQPVSAKRPTGGTEMRPRWIPIAMVAVGLTLAPVMVSAQMAPGGRMEPGMRGGMGPMRGGMGTGGMMQMQGMMQQMQGMMQQMADMLKTGTMSPEQMKQMGELMAQMTAQMGQAHDMMGGMGAGGRDPRAMHEQMSRMQQHMADMQKHMAEMMGSTPGASPPASPEKK